MVINLYWAHSASRQPHGVSPVQCTLLDDLFSNLLINWPFLTSSQSLLSDNRFPFFFLPQTEEIEAISFDILLIHIGWLSYICTSLGFALLWMKLQILLKQARFFSCAIHSILFLSKDIASNSSSFFLIAFSWDYGIRGWELGRALHCSFSISQPACY